MRGFLSSVAVGFAVAVLAFAFAVSTIQLLEANSSVLALESQVVHERALDARALADAAFHDALIDAGYASMPCAGPSDGFCQNLTAGFPLYLNNVSEALNDSLYSVLFEAAVSCVSVPPQGGYAAGYYANYSLIARVNSSKASELFDLANATLADVNLTTIDPQAFQLRLRYPSGAVLHSFEFSCS